MGNPRVGSFLHMMGVSHRTYNDLSIIWVRAMVIPGLIALNHVPAPEYALDEVLVTASDIYSLGAVIYAVHCKGNPPFKNHASLGGLRENAGKPLPGMDRLDTDLQGEPYSVCFYINSLIFCCACSAPPIPCYSGLTATTHSYNASIAALLLVTAYIHAQFSGPVKLQYKISGRKDFVYEGPDWCPDQVLRRPSYTQNSTHTFGGGRCSLGR